MAKRVLPQKSGLAPIVEICDRFLAVVPDLPDRATDISPACPGAAACAPRLALWLTAMVVVYRTRYMYALVWLKNACLCHNNAATAGGATVPYRGAGDHALSGGISRRSYALARANLSFEA